MPFAIANEQKARVIRHLTPFVKIKRDRIGVFQSGQARRKRGRENAKRAIGAIDVKPELFLAAQRTQRFEVVNRTDIDRAGRADHEEWPQADLAIPFDLRAHRRHVDAMRAIDRHTPQRVAAEARKIHCL